MPKNLPRPSSPKISKTKRDQDAVWMRLALDLAARGRGWVSPNPMVGAVLVRAGLVIGQGWHRKVGGPHAEIEALRDARVQRQSTPGADLYVTLEPCSTQGRTPPCTDALIRAGLNRVVVGAIDPNPAHAGRGLDLLRAAGLEVVQGILQDESSELNEAFNHWIVHKTPFVLVKAALTLDGKIATAKGQSKWITSPAARDRAMQLRHQFDAILVGINTVLADDPSLTVRLPVSSSAPDASSTPDPVRQPRRIILDANARMPLTSRVVTDEHASLTTVVVCPTAPRPRVAALKSKTKARILEAPAKDGLIDLRWLLAHLGQEEVTGLLVEGGGQVNASFLMQSLAQRVAFFFAPKVLGGHDARKAVGGVGAVDLNTAQSLGDMRWEQLGPDLLLLARPQPGPGASLGQETSRIVQAKAKPESRLAAMHVSGKAGH